VNDEICDESSVFVCDGPSDGIYVEILVGDRDGFNEASDDGRDVETADGSSVRSSVGSCDSVTEGSDDVIVIIDENSVGSSDETSIGNCEGAEEFSGGKCFDVGACVATTDLLIDGV